jgi:hypothetical protein
MPRLGLRVAGLSPQRLVFDPRAVLLGFAVYVMQLGRVFLRVLAFLRARGGAVVLGTALQAGRARLRFPMVSLEFFIKPTQPLTEMSTRNISGGVKAAGA